MHPDNFPARPSLQQRAGVLGVITAVVTATSAGWAVMSSIDAYAALSNRASIQTVDAVPLVVRGGLAAVLTWAFVLVVLGLRALYDARELLGAPAMSPCAVPAASCGPGQRTALILLTLSAMTTIGLQPAVAQAATAVSTEAEAGQRSAPLVPGFSGAPGASWTSVPDPSFGPQPCVPVPGWTASAPARTRHSGSSTASLITGCDRRSTDSPDVVVRRGDSLWTLVARHLRTEDPGLIAAEWPRWYAANRGAIGPDPDLLLVGQVLRLPVPAGDSPDLQGLPR